MPDTETSLEDPVYEWLDGVEDPNGYHVGGYHPVNINDELSDGRYHVVHKLGFGGYSTVWLAKDRNTGKYVAVKILCAEPSASNHESHILRLLEQNRVENSGLAGGKYVAQLIDEFFVEGHNGRHACLVSEPAGFNIHAAREDSIVRMFSPQMARAITAKIIMGVHFVHSSGVVHGDLHIGNILLKTSDLNELSIDDLYQRFGEPERLAIERIDRAPLDAEVPSHAVIPLWSAVACEDITQAEVTITDFSEAYVAGGASRERLNTPLLLCPPEMLLEKGTISMPADIWTLGCTLVNIVGKKALFEGWAPDNDDVMAELVSAFGKPPDSWWQAWHKRHEFFLEDGSWSVSPDRRHDNVSRSLEWRVTTRMKRGNEGADEGEVKAMLEMLKGMLAWDPQDRWRIEDIVHSEWMEEFGKPAIEALASEAKLDRAPMHEESHGHDENLAESCSNLSLSRKDSSNEFEKAASNAPNPATAPNDSFGLAPSSVSRPQENPESGDNHSSNPTEVSADAQESPETTQIPARSSSPISRFFDSVFRNGRNPSQDQENASKPSADPFKGYQTSNSPQSDSTAIPEIVIHGIESSDKDTTGDDGSSRQETVEEGKAEDPDTESTS
ncbi:MAG: hypothetical protein Q9181_006980 [Wetmoreana brouardii]